MFVNSRAIYPCFEYRLFSLWGSSYQLDQGPGNGTLVFLGILIRGCFFQKATVQRSNLIDD